VIPVRTPFGTVRVTWDISWAQTAPLTQAYLAASGQLKALDTHEIWADVLLKYDCNFLWLHSAKLEQYTDWIGHLTQYLTDLDWHSARQDLLMGILTAIATRLSILPAKGEGVSSLEHG
jgi:hypothetical protein